MAEKKPATKKASVKAATAENETIVNPAPAKKASV